MYPQKKSLYRLKNRTVEYLQKQCKSEAHPLHFSYRSRVAHRYSANRAQNSALFKVKRAFLSLFYLWYIDLTPASWINLWWKTPFVRSPMFDSKIVMSISGLAFKIKVSCFTVRNLSWKILKDDLKNVLKDTMSWYFWCYFTVILIFDLYLNIKTNLSLRVQEAFRMLEKKLIYEGHFTLKVSLAPLAKIIVFFKDLQSVKILFVPKRSCTLFHRVKYPSALCCLLALPFPIYSWFLFPFLYSFEYPFPFHMFCFFGIPCSEPI